MKTNVLRNITLAYSAAPARQSGVFFAARLSTGWACLRFVAILWGVGMSLNSAAQPVSTGSATLDRIVARGSIHLGYRESAPPFSYLAPGNDQPRGYMWDVCRHVVTAMEQELGKRLTVVPVPTTDNARTMLLKTGVIDLDCGAAVNSVARQKQVAFSYNLYASELRVLVREEAPIDSFQQLAGKRIVVMAGGLVERQLKQRALAGELAFTMMLADSALEAAAMLARGEADAFVGEDVLLAAEAARHAGRLRLLASVLASEPLGIMLPKDDTVLKQRVDAALLPLMQGAAVTQIYEQWFLLPIPPRGETLNLPMSPAVKAMLADPGDVPVH